MRRPVALPGNRLSPLATAGLDRWPSKTELGLQTPLTFARRAFGRGVCLRKAVRAAVEERHPDCRCIIQIDKSYT